MAELTSKTEQELDARLGRDRVERGVPLASLTTFRIGGSADLFYRARSAEELAAALRVMASSCWTHPST